MTLVEPQPNAYIAPDGPVSPGGPVSRDGPVLPDGPVSRDGWVRVCALDDLEVERGRAALLGGTQIALFLLHSPNGEGRRVHAVSNLDPYSGAHVISRGIVGTRQDAPTVASPMYKQVFDLRTGECLDTQGKEPRRLHVWPVALDDGHVLVKWEE